jgi:hypothetical protein
MARAGSRLICPYDAWTVDAATYTDTTAQDHVVQLTAIRDEVDARWRRWVGLPPRSRTNA